MNSLDQGYVDNNPDLLNCGTACLSSPEIENILQADYEIQRRGIYVEEGGDITLSNINRPWGQSRVKWLRKFGRNLHRRPERYKASAFRIGVRMQTRDALSSVLIEIRKPILYDLRNWATRPFKNKKGNVKAWFLEQTIDVGASAIGLESNGYTTSIIDTDEIIKRKSSIITSFKPRLDPYKGRYGVKFQSFSYFNKLRDPFAFQISYFYCNSTAGLGDRICPFLHQIQTTYGYRLRANKTDVSLGLSVYYEVKSRDEEAYVVDEVAYDFKPWGFRANMSFAL